MGALECPSSRQRRAYRLFSCSTASLKCVMPVQHARRSPASAKSDLRARMDFQIPDRGRWKMAESMNAALRLLELVTATRQRSAETSLSVPFLVRSV
jgi:hypothetical protein